MAEYNGTIDLISGIRPKNNGSFPLVDAKDVQVDDSGKRLDAAFTEIEEALSEVSQNAKAIPEFDLTEMGLSALSLNSSGTATGDMTELVNALKSGAVKVTFQASFQADEEAKSYTLLFNNALSTSESTSATSFIDAGNKKVSLNIVVIAKVLIAFLKIVDELPPHDTTSSGNILSVNADGEAVWVEAPSAETPSAETPVFDLASLGLPNIPYGNENGAYLETDTTEIMAAVARGAVTFKTTADVPYGDMLLPIPFITTLNPVLSGEQYICATCLPMLTELDCLIVYVGDGYVKVVAYPIELGGEAEVATSIDLSMLESNGQIVETYADGSTKMTQLEFDANGNPIKITDGDGNVTTLVW